MLEEQEGRKMLEEQEVLEVSEVSEESEVLEVLAMYPGAGWWSTSASGTARSLWWFLMKG